MDDLHKLETFVADGVFHVVVERPRGAAVKLKYSPELGAMSVSRPLVLGLEYACDWGFAPSTEARTATRSMLRSGGTCPPILGIASSRHVFVDLRHGVGPARWAVT